MKRLKIDALKKWYQEKNRKPLILRGARQVGKSTLVRMFAKENNLELIEINLEKNRFRSLDGDFNITSWKQEIEMISSKKIGENSLIFLDEIQATPLAISRLRYFFEESPECAVICAGSLLEIVLHQEEISFPVGRVSFLWLSPMTFTEYLNAIGENQLAQNILDNKIPRFAHERLIEEAKKYFFIGGMPRAVKTYVETKSFVEVRKIQEEILTAYSIDFPKYEKRAKVDRLNNLFQKIPFYLGKKIIYQHIDQALRGSDIKKVIELFLRAGIVTPCYHTNASGIPLRAGVDQSVFKIYFLDIGLINCAHQIKWDELNTLFEKSFLSKGFLAEQFIAQHLSYYYNTYGNPEALFWLKDKKIEKAEIDFLITVDSRILPIEVKAGKGGRLKSMEVFCKEKSIKKGVKFSAEFFNSDSIRIKNELICDVDNWPYYAIEGFLAVNG